MNVTEPPVSATVTVTVGVVSLVTRSELLEPESLPESRVGATGAEGATVSRMIESSADPGAASTLPAASVATVYT